MDPSGGGGGGQFFTCCTEIFRPATSCYHAVTIQLTRLQGRLVPCEEKHFRSISLLLSPSSSPSPCTSLEAGGEGEQHR